MDQWFFRSVTLSGHRYVPDQDKLIFSMADGTLREIPAASKLEIRLNKETVTTLNEQMKKAKQDADNANAQVETNK